MCEHLTGSNVGAAHHPAMLRTGPHIEDLSIRDERSPGFLPCGHRLVSSSLAGVPGSYLPKVID